MRHQCQQLGAHRIIKLVQGRTRDADRTLSTEVPLGRAGANVKAVQKMLGHASAAMTLDIYADLFDDDLEAVATALHEARNRLSR